MRRLDQDKVHKIIELRRSGNSIPEISRKLGISKTTIQRYVLNVTIPAQYLRRLKEKQGGSKVRAAGLRSNVLEEASVLLGQLSDRDLLILLIGLYWGEGTKKDFGIINSDPNLIQAFIRCIKALGIEETRISLSLRLHMEIPVKSAKKFWSAIAGLPESTIGRIEIIEGKKKGKLQYGMCRVRIRSGIRERLLIQSAIALIGKECQKKLVSI